MPEATVLPSTALLTTGTEAWSVRVATHVLLRSRHTHHVTTAVNMHGYGMGMDEGEGC